MIDLNLLEPQALTEKTVSEGISQQQFDKIATLIEKEDLETAVEMIRAILLEGNLDIRLIVYYLSAHFLEQGVKSFSSAFPILRSLLENHWESLKPNNRKERQVESSMNWFFTYLLNRLKYSEKLGKEGKGDFLWEITVSLSEKEFKEVLTATQNFRDFFYEKWSHSPNKERITHIVKKIEDLHPLIFSETGQQNPEPSSAHQNITSAPIGDISPPPSTKTGVFDSVPMDLFIKKLKTFEELIKKKEFLKAAMISQDISQLIEKFDPCHYFPRLFTEYFVLLAKHISTLAEEWQNQESLQWKSLEKLYKTDIDRFVQW